MTKKVVRKSKVEAKKEKKEAVEPAVSFSLTQLYYDIDTVKIKMQYFTDAELFEYCLPHLEMYEHRELDRLYPKISAGGKLSKKERESLEAFCILANTELCLTV